MYGYRDSSFTIKKEAILARVKQEDIFRMALGLNPKLYQYYVSPFREDNNPGCYFEWYKGTLYFVDWTLETKRRHRDCFNAVQDIFGLNFNQALVKITRYFKLESEEEVYKVVDKKKSKKVIKNPSQITFKARSFNNQTDKEFWLKRYHITKQNLIEDNVFPIIWYRVYSKRLKSFIVIRPLTRSYCVGTFESRVKIYTPDQKGKGKWITNCNQNDIGGSGRSSGKLLIITKAYKDYRVLKNQGLNVRWNQNEGMLPSKEVLYDLVSGFDRVCILFDNDKTGLRSAKHFVQVINDMLPEKAYSVTVPVYDKVVDPSDLIYRKGKDCLREFLIEKGLLDGQYPF